MSVARTDKEAVAALAEQLRLSMLRVAAGHKVKEGKEATPGSVDCVKNPKGSIVKEVGALGFALTDLDSWYSILMSSLVAFVLNRSNYFLKVQGSSFTREFLVFTLFELLQPKLSSVIPRYGVDDIDTHRYRAGGGKDASSRRLAAAGPATLIAEEWEWDVMFAEWANALPVVLICMVIVDVGLGKRSDLRSLMHYMFVMLVVSGSRYVKNQVLINNPGRQSSVEIFRRAMALGHSFETVPTVKYTGKAPPRLYTYDPTSAPDVRFAPKTELPT